MAHLRDRITPQHCRNLGKLGLSIQALQEPCQASLSVCQAGNIHHLPDCFVTLFVPCTAFMSRDVCVCIYMTVIRVRAATLTLHLCGSHLPLSNADLALFVSFFSPPHFLFILAEDVSYFLV